jgi:predicted RNA-binding protein (virulence factor B family)
MSYIQIPPEEKKLNVSSGENINNRIISIKQDGRRCPKNFHEDGGKK